MRLLSVLLLCFSFCFTVEATPVKKAAPAPATSSKVQQANEMFQRFFKKHSLMLFYSSRCGHCHHSAPVLSSWAKKHQVQVDARAFDNRPLRPFFTKYAKANDSLVKKAFGEHPRATPALFIVDKDFEAFYPVTIGMLDYDHLNQRLYQVVRLISG